ncbi:MAG TPA: dihydrolipoamide acetyltransferase family protein [Pseudolabrys sp.]|nr:dihydrolipoamide acetyltransferase family protein [Pseudolabrys sp.]
MDVLMPQLGETVAEGKIVKWFKAAGDDVKPGDNLFEIETDKTSMEVPATSAGKLTDIRFQVGDTAKVGAVVAIIDDGKGASASAPAAAAAAAPPASAPANQAAASPPPTPAKAGAQGQNTSARRQELGPRFRGDERREDHRSFAYPHMDPFREVRTPDKNYGPANIGGATVTPLARRLAGERGIDLSNIKGSGPHGRIVAADVEKAAPGSGALALAAGPSAAQVKALFDGVDYQEVPLDSMRATIAKRLTEAVQTIPTFYLMADIDIGRLSAMREEANNAAPKDRDGQPAFKLSLNDFIIKAWGAALMRTPAANAVWAQDRILRFAHADIGVAVALDGGLITPVIRNVDSKSVSAISAEMRDLATRGRDKKLKPHEYQGGSSAISNLGMYGMREFTAIINPPHATILAIGASRRAPVETADGGVKFVSQMTATLSCDHRVLDGALGAELLATFKSLVEMPVTALI